MRDLKLRYPKVLMNVVVVVVTRSSSIAVKTLHTLLSLNRMSSIKGLRLQIVFVNDDAFEKKATLLKYSKDCDRLVWINFSVFVDE